MAETKPQGQDLNFTRTVDANGWTVYDYGTFKQYRKRGSISFSIGASAWTSGYNIGALPVGMSTIGSNFVEGSAAGGDAAITVSIYSISTSTTIGIMISNQYGGTVTNTIPWSICITTP